MFEAFRPFFESPKTQKVWHDHSTGHLLSRMVRD